MRTSTAGNSNRPAGFTLVELTVVVALISLFVLLSLPLMMRVGTDPLEGTARRLSGTIKYLFNEAVLTGLEHRLIFDLGNGTYRAQVLHPDGELRAEPDPKGSSSLPERVRFRDLQVPGRGTFTGGQVTTRIFPSGWIEETIIHLAAENGELLTVRIMPLTGTTETFAGYREFAR